MSKVRDLIKANEGLSLVVYTCTGGKKTIGYGRNLEDKGISRQEAELMLDMDIEECERDVKRFPFWHDLTEDRQAVLIDMRFQLGYAGLRQFKKMLQAIAVSDYDSAADELLDSRYAKQTPNRAQRNAEMMRNKPQD